MVEKKPSQRRRASAAKKAVEPKIGSDRQKNTGNAGKGRPPGARNKNTKLLKDALLLAAENAGGPEGLVGYLTTQAQENPGPFMALLGKVLPVQLQGDPSAPINIVIRDPFAHLRDDADGDGGV